MRSAADGLAQAFATPPGFYGFLTAVNHRAIGARYVVTAFGFLLLGGVLGLIMRVQLAYPSLELISPDRFNQLFTMHGSTMMFLFAVPMAEGIGIYLVPLMIGTRDMAFPRMNAFGYWVYLIAGLTLYAAFFVGAAPDAGWFNYPPLSGPGFSPGARIDFWTTMITFIEVAALVAAVELIVTVFKQRAPGMSLDRLPLFVWAQVVMSFMIVFAMPPLMVTSVLLALDRTVGTHFFNPAAGGEPLLWQHLFWIFGHPDVYIILLPALGVVSAVLPVFARTRMVGYTAIAAATVALGFLSFGLWVHHMYATGLTLLGLNFFAAASMMVTIPSSIQIFAWIATLWRGQKLVISTAMLYVIGFLVLFILGGITGVMIASPAFDWQVHDTYFIVAHFHYVLVGGAVFPFFAAFYFWFPKVTGRLLDERLGRWNFWLTTLGFNLTFLPMHLSGFRGMPRRVYTYLPELGVGGLNLASTIGAFLMALGVLVFVVNVAWSLLLGARAGRNPWNGDTLEWATSSPPPAYNFAVIPVIRSRHPLWDQPEVRKLDAGAEDDRWGLANPEHPKREIVVTSTVDAEVQARPVLPGPSIWPLFLALSSAVAFLGSVVHPILVVLGFLGAYVSALGWLWPDREAWERDLMAARTHPPLPRIVMGPRATVWWGMVMLVTIETTVFASLILAYFYLRAGAAEWPLGGIDTPDLGLPTVNTVVLLLSALAIAWSHHGILRGHEHRLLIGKAIGMALLVVFLVLKAVEYGGYDYDWRVNAYGSIVWTMTGFHVAHVITVLLKSAAIWVLAWKGFFSETRFLAVESNALYWYFVALIWLPLYATLYLSHYLR